DALDLAGVAVHGMGASQALDDTLDRGANPEGLAAADAVEGIGAIEFAGAARLLAEIEAWLEGNHLFRAGRPAESALDAVFLDEAQPRPFRIVDQGGRRANRDTGLAHGAAAGVEVEAAKGSARCQRQDIQRLDRK